MLEPSDPSGAYPINRLEAIFEKRRAWEAMWQRTQGGAEEPPSSSAEAPPAVEPVRLNRRELYRTVYALARTEAELGESPQAIRAGFAEMAEEYREMAGTIKKAISDALEGRPPRW
jgi:hypothetical protein